MKIRWRTIILGCALLLLLVQGAAGMSSPDYRLDWYTLMDSSGGGPASSANYAINYTIGQSAIGPSASPNYHVGLGYWYGLILYKINLPLIAKQ